MKFAEHLGAHITPEWRKQYIQYEVMKDMLYAAIEQAPSADVVDQSAIQRFQARFDESFFQFCDKELAKINTFFLEKLSEATRKYASLKADLDIYMEHIARANPSTFGVRRQSSIYHRFKDRENPGSTHMRKLHDLKLAFSEFYLSLILLQNYQSLNFTGFRKILKKHDKLMHTHNGTEWRQAHVETAPFYTNKEVDHLITDTEHSVTTELEGGNRQKAMKRLRVPPLGDQQNPWTNFKVGLFLGMFAILLITIIIVDLGPIKEAIFTDTIDSQTWIPALRMFRGFFLIIFILFLLGLNTYGWRSSGVNHVLIFEIDPRHHLSHVELLELASFLAVVWSVCVLGFQFSAALTIHRMVFPLALAIGLLLFIINPIKIAYYSARMWLLKVLFRIFTAPFHHVGFADFWLADQLNSLTTALLDFEYLICYYSFEVDWIGLDRPDVCTKNVFGIRAVVGCLPAWFRFAQCLRRYRDTKLLFPHVVNAGKYSTSFFVMLFSTLYKVHKEVYGDSYRQTSVFFYLWIAAALVSSCYTSWWDIKMDWGLFDKNAGENRFLREEIVYAYKGYYYFVIVEDLILRFAWSLSVSIGEGLLFNNEMLTTLVSCAEVFRRFIWNFFRLENEHLNNCGQFRAVRDISIGPVDSNNEAQLIEMMDEPDGVNSRHIQTKNRFIGSPKKESRMWIDTDEEKVPLMKNKVKGL